MKTIPFKKSKELSLGVELELQLIDPMNFDLISRAKALIRSISLRKYKENIKPEVTQGMIEINSSIHLSIKDLHKELNEIRDFLLKQGENVGISMCGGGTHPFRKWSLNKIFPTKRYKKLSHQYRFLSKRSTVFGFHIHVGCLNAEDALYLTHALARYVPHLLAMSASSPFYEGVDTGYHTTRSVNFSSFPTSGVIPYLLTWKEFSRYFYKMKKTKMISSMKDFYWDIRPKPEFGTVEIRVCDTPLTIKKVVMIAAYIQALSYYLLHEKPIKISEDLYYLYRHNRFLASRYGLDGSIIDPSEMRYIKMTDDIQATIRKIKKYAKKLNNSKYIAQLSKEISQKKNDAKLLHTIYKKYNSFPRVVQEQCNLWKKT